MDEVSGEWRRKSARANVVKEGRSAVKDPGAWRQLAEEGTADREGVGGQHEVEWKAMVAN